jgi:hypothetical protein
MRSEVDHRPDFRLGAALALVIGGCVAGLSAWAWSVEDRLPDPVARHWGAAGVADGFSSLGGTLWVAIGLLLIVASPMALVAVFARQPALMRRFMAGTAAWLAVFITVLIADSLRGQIDLADPAMAPVPGPGIAIGIVAGLGVAFGVAALARPDDGTTRASNPPPDSAMRADRNEGELAWSAGPAGLDRAAVVVALVVGVGLGALAATLTWWLLPVAILVSGLVLSAGRVSTTADREGLTVTVLGWKAVHVPLSDIAVADVVEVDPFWEFGGWGLRVDMAGRTGVVTRKGPAVRVRRGDQSEVIVTVDEPERAAGTLNSLADEFHRRT